MREPRNTDLAGLHRSIWRDIQHDIDSDVYIPRNPIASGLHIPCPRKLYHDVVDAAIRPKFEVQEKFRANRGKSRERWWTSYLTELGGRARPRFEFVAAQERVTIPDRRGRIILSGKIDGRIVFGQRRRREIPVEFKAPHDGTWESIETLADLSRMPWRQGDVWQMCAYLYGLSREGKDYPLGALIYDGPGFPKILEVELERHLEGMERWLAMSEAAMDAIEKREPPQGVDSAPACTMCWARDRVCFPKLQHPPHEVITGEEEERNVARLVELREVGEEYQRLQEWAKERFRGVREALCGPHLIRGSYSPLTRYMVPDRIRDRFRVVDQEGQFRLQIEKL